MVTDQTYTDSFYDTIDNGCRTSAEVIVPLLTSDFVTHSWWPTALVGHLFNPWGSTW